MSLADRITLYCREGKSDKVYNAEIVKQGDGFVVNIAYGRRGGTMKTGTKTPKPVSRDKAQYIYGNLVLDKVGKGYDTKEPTGEKAPAPRPTEKPVWDHPERGRFTYDGSFWTRSITVPAFKAFKFRGPSNGKCHVSFEADDENELPSSVAVALAEKVLAHQKEIVAKVITAMWDDFTGRGPDSGMYWHDDLEQVAEGLEFEDDLAPPKKATDLFKLMSSPDIHVHKKVFYYDKPVVELSFAAAFEEEHGLGILTDANTIIGIGYSSDVTPFKKAKRKR